VKAIIFCNAYRQDGRALKADSHRTLTARSAAGSFLHGYGHLPAWEREAGGELPQVTMATQRDESDHNYLCRRREAGLQLLGRRRYKCRLGTTRIQLL
jgi:hypothetical protein